VATTTTKVQEPRQVRVAPPAPRPAVPVRPPWLQRYGPDLVVAGVLLVIAFLARRHGLPTDGLWHDDTNPAAGAKAVSSLSDLFAVSIEHPGFTALLMGWRDLIDGGDASWTYPALIAGSLSPPLLYLALRGCGYERSISALLGAALAAAQTDIIFSGRIRTYTTDLLIVLGLAMIVPRLARIRWRWQTAVAWVVAAFVVATFSGFALIAVALAGVTILLHPRSDLRVRAAAVATQAAASAALLAATSSTYDVTLARDRWRDVFDAFPTFHLNPFRFADEVFVHLRRLAETYPGGPSALAAVCIVVALIGLVTIVWKGRQAIRARYLLLLFGVVFVGGLLGILPFGPTQGPTSDYGGRVSLWLIPVLAIGLAAALQGLRSLLPDRRTLRTGFDAAAYLAGAAILVSAVTADHPPYPSTGAKSATDFVQSHLGQRDSVLIGFHANWSFAAESNFPYKVDPTPSTTYGFVPDFTDPRIHYLDVGLHAERGLGPELVDPRHVAPEVMHADRVFVYYHMPPVPGWDPGAQTRLDSTLRKLGFGQQPTAHFGVASVEVWRGPEAAAGSPEAAAARSGPRTKAPGAAAVNLKTVNLRRSDLSPRWQITSPPTNPVSTGILSCLGVPNPPTPNAVAVAGPQPKNQLRAVSEITGWPSAAAAREAFKALSGPRAAGCIESTEGSALRSSGFPVSISGRKVPPPRAGGNPAVAYAGTVRTPNVARQVGAGSLAYFTRGKIGVLIGGLRVGPGAFPPKLLSSWVSTVAERVNAAAQRGG
jgi:hypothetical protein